MSGSNEASPDDSGPPEVFPPGARPLDVLDPSQLDEPPPPTEPEDEGERTARRRGWALLVAAALLYLGTFVWFFPPTHAIEDEVGYLNMAAVWSQGALTAEGAGYEALADFDLGPRGTVGWRNPGRALVTAPAVALGGYRAAFLLSALIHVALALCAGAALVSLRRSPAWALLVLWHPTLLLYSRTVMADELSGLFLCAALALALRRHALLAGAAFALACSARFQVAIALPFFVLALLRHDGKRAALQAFATAAAGGALLVAYNLYALGHPLGTTRQGFFALNLIPGHAAHYGQALLLLWPGMLLTPFLWAAWRYRHRHEHVAPSLDRGAALLAALTLPLLAFLLPYYFVDRDPSGRFLIELVIGQRLLQPMLAVWIVAYAALLARCLPTRLEPHLPKAAGALLLCGFLGNCALQSRHQEHLQRYADARDTLIEHVPPDSLVLCNRTLSKLFEVPLVPAPPYRLTLYEFQGQLLEHTDTVNAEPTKVYFAHLRKTEGQPVPPFDALLKRHPNAKPLLQGRLLLYELTPTKSRKP